MKKFKIGDSIIVKPGVKDPDFDNELGGWHGRIVAINPEHPNQLEIQWDSATLLAMEDELINVCLEEGLELGVMVLLDHEIAPAQARDTPADVDNALQTIYARYGREYKTDFENVVEAFLDSTLPDDFDDEDWEEEGFEAFDLHNFFAELQIEDLDEQERILTAFGKGLENYYRELYGYHKYGKQPEGLIPERMGEPHIFGYGAVEVIRSPQISDPTKVKIGNYTLQQIQPDRDNGIPHGLVSITSWAAAHHILPLDAFRGALQITQLERGWSDDWQKVEIIQLSDWVIVHDEMPLDEKLWWLWLFSSQLSPYVKRDKPIVDHWLAHPDLTDGAKRDLCWAWLTRERAGAPPAVWRLAEAQFTNDVEAAKAALEELGATPIQSQQILDSMKLLAQADPLAQLLRFSTMAFDPVMKFIDMPNWLRRLAVPALIRLGEEPLGVCTLLLDHDRNYGSEATNMGVADAIAEFSDQLPQAEIRRMIEKALEIPNVQTRKTFYSLSTQFFGDEYLKRTQQDSAASIRQWGQKKLQER